MKVPGEIDRDAPEGTQEKAQFDFKAEIDMHTKIMESGDPACPVIRGGSACRLVRFQPCRSLHQRRHVQDDDKCCEEPVADRLISPGACAVGGRPHPVHSGISRSFQNVFINSKGVGKIADFGETAFGKSFSLSNEKIVENPLYLAPENLVANEKLATFEMKAVEHQYAHLKAKVEAHVLG